ncbi:MAG: urease accessory protein UreD [Candidatus Hydrogenedentota bacterium]
MSEAALGVIARDQNAQHLHSSEAQWSRIRVASWKGTSRIVSCKNVQPLKILNPRNLSESSQVYLSSYGGGLVAGDNIQLEIDCEHDSKFFLGTQADTKVYKSFDGKPARQHVRGKLASGALAVILPDALIPFAGSRLEQLQEWHLDASANVMLVDWLHSGRTAYGECFDYDYLSSEVRIHIDGKKRIIDRLRIEPAKDNPYGAGAFGPYRSLLSVYIVGRKLVRALEGLDIFKSSGASGTDGPTNDARLWVVANPVGEDALIVRAMSTKKESLSAYVKALGKAVASPEILGFNPCKRKF